MMKAGSIVRFFIFIQIKGREKIFSPGLFSFAILFPAFLDGLRLLAFVFIEAMEYTENHGQKKRCNAPHGGISVFIIYIDGH